MYQLHLINFIAKIASISLHIFLLWTGRYYLLQSSSPLVPVQSVCSRIISYKILNTNAANVLSLIKWTASQMGCSVPVFKLGPWEWQRWSETHERHWSAYKGCSITDHKGSFVLNVTVTVGSVYIYNFYYLWCIFSKWETHKWKDTLQLSVSAEISSKCLIGLGVGWNATDRGHNVGNSSFSP